VGRALAHLVEALRYKPERRFFDSQLCRRDFFVYMILPYAVWPWVESASNRNDYQEYLVVGGGLRRPVRRANNLNTYICQLS